jgi:hypothetical protein
LAAGFGELAAQLGARELLDAADPLASVHGVLAAFPAEWLLVFDNAPDLASVAPFVPPAGRGRVLITSRDQIWPPGQALGVPMLDLGVAAEFLASRTGDPDRQAALELAGELGGLPRALEQAAAYIQASADSVVGYLTLFRQRRTEMLARGEPTGYGETVATTWRLAFDHLQGEPGAVGLLRLLASCAPEAIPLSLLLQPRPGLDDKFDPEIAPLLVPVLEDPLTANDAIAALRRYSLISPPVDGSVWMHRLVQAITLTQLTAEVQSGWRQAAATLIEKALPGYNRDPATWPVFAALLPHAQATLPTHSRGMGKIADYLGSSGSYAAALDLYQQIYARREQVLGPDDRETLTARAELAYWIGMAGDAGRARDQYAALLPVEERVSGAEHPDTLIARSQLAYWTGQAGDAAGARDQYAAVLPVTERVFGAEHLATLETRRHCADSTGWAGDAPGARDQLATLLPVMKRVLGSRHPETLIARGDLGLWTGMAGDASSARDQFAELLPTLERILGAERQNTLTARHNFGMWTRKARRGRWRGKK